MDALAFLRERTKTRLGRVLFCVLCLLPVAGGLLGHILSHKWAFMDIDAVLCAARSEAAGRSPYDLLPNCPGLGPAPYVYAPQVAALFIPLIHAVGLLGARWIYLCVLFVPATVALVWYALGRGLPGADWRYRLLAVSGLSTMAFWSANFGMVMHAAVIFSLLASPRRKAPFVAAVLACAFIKPTFLVYFAIYLFENRPWRDRLMAFCLASAAGVAVVAATVLTAGPLGVAWKEAIGAVALSQQPGVGWLALTTWLRLAPNAPATLGLTLPYVVAMAASGVAMAEAAKLDDDARLVLALGLVPLMTPRLMDYDMLALVPAMAVVMQVQPLLGGRIYRYNVSWMFVGVLGFGAVANVSHLFRDWPRTPMAMAVFCIAVLAGGARLATKAWAALRLEKKKRAAGADEKRKGHAQGPSSYPASVGR